jgi:hypothetical protein
MDLEQSQRFGTKSEGGECRPQGDPVILGDQGEKNVDAPGFVGAQRAVPLQNPAVDNTAVF